MFLSYCYNHGEKFFSFQIDNEDDIIEGDWTDIKKFLTNQTIR
jgi:hypothetical protein